VEYLPIPIYPEIYGIYLIVGIALATVAGIVLYLLKFSKQTHLRFSKILKRISNLEDGQKKLSDDIKSIRDKIVPTKAPSDLFRFILLRYLASEREMSPADKLLFALAMGGATPTREMTELLTSVLSKEETKKISDDKVEEIISSLTDKTKESIKRKIREKL
jgi:hypothetical protein